MPSKNDITGDSIKSKVGGYGEQNKYSDGWDRIFGKKEEKNENTEQEKLKSESELSS